MNQTGCVIGHVLVNECVVGLAIGCYVVLVNGCVNENTNANEKMPIDDRCVCPTAIDCVAYRVDYVVVIDDVSLVNAIVVLTMANQMLSRLDCDLSQPLTVGTLLTDLQ